MLIEKRATIEVGDVERDVTMVMDVHASEPRTRDYPGSEAHADATEVVYADTGEAVSEEIVNAYAEDWSVEALEDMDAAAESNREQAEYARAVRRALRAGANPEKLRI